MSHILTSREGLVGYITLDRPKALNSLTHDMISDIHAAVVLHEADHAVEVIVLRSNSERAFCAGGDMKVTREMALDKKWDELKHFFEKEYELNLHIAQCAKPYVSLVDGIAMGGGLGLSVHGNVLVVSENALLAMPETAIGFFPDVGGTHFLSKLPHSAGQWLSLSGMPVRAKEAVAVGLATHYVAQAHWAELISALETQGAQALENTLKKLTDNTIDASFVETLAQRENWFQANDHDQLVSTLRASSDASEDAAKLLKRIESMSPYAMNLTRRLLADAKKQDLAQCLKMELKAGEEAVRHPDFVEGVRAVLVDKDKAVWVS